MSPNTTQALFLNHACLLIRYGDEYLVTDPWYQSSGFGSWLPVPPMFAHPAYLASLGRKLRVLISHGHDDHCDDQLLGLLDPATEVYIADYKSPGLRRRLEKIGLRDVRSVGSDGISTGPFTLNAYINQELSLDDAIFAIKTPDSFVVHANDHWAPLPDAAVEGIQKNLTDIDPSRRLYASQTNSASGFPLNYTCFTSKERDELLLIKVKKMFEVGMQNAAKTGIQAFLPYAGYTGVFVKDKDYLNENFFPTPAFLKSIPGITIPAGVSVLDMVPGDSYDFQTVNKSFFSQKDTDNLKKASQRFYETYGILDELASYRPSDTPMGQNELKERLDFFLKEFDGFVRRKVESNNFMPTIIGKTFVVEVTDRNLIQAVRFGEGLVEHYSPNKKLSIKSNILESILLGQDWFESVYTGYLGEFERYPANVYNHDIIMYLVMYTYVYRNQILPKVTKGQGDLKAF